MEFLGVPLCEMACSFALQSVAFNSEMTEITINGRNKSEVEHLVQRVGYINTRTFPTPGHRNIKVETDVK